MNDEPLHYTIMTGNPVEGFCLYGAFQSIDEASQAANEDAHLPPDWWIVPVLPMD